MKILKNRNFIIMAVTVSILGLCAALSGIFPRQPVVNAEAQLVEDIEDFRANPVLTIEEMEEEVPEVNIVVHVAGEIVNPGVYALPIGTRVVDAVAIAGGMTSNAAGNSVNLALPISDGQQIYIPTKDEVEPRQIGEVKDRLVVTSVHVEESIEEAFPINVNTAKLNELILIPGVGEVTAKNIISCRDANGPFNSVEELTNVTGIGEAKLLKIKPYIKVN